MDDPRIASVVRALRAAGTAARRRVADWYFPTALEALGVATGPMRTIARGLIASLKAAPPREVAAIARALVATRIFEARGVAYELVERRRDALAALGAKGVETLGKGNDNWGSVDHYGVTVAGPAWRLGVVRDADIARWARAKDRWWRRTALVATVGLNARSRGGLGDAPRTFAVCARLADDRDDMIVKATSWALRELAKREPSAVARWLEEHEARLHRRVVREVRSKLTTGRKRA